MTDATGGGGAPRISVLIPVRDQARYLPHALASVARQGRDDLEVIVVDDGSADQPERAVAGFPRLRLVRRERRGITDTLNFALGLARAEYITFLDADDWWSDDKLARQAGMLDGRPDVEIVVGAVQPVRCAGEDPVRAAVTPLSVPFPLLNLGSVMMRRSAFDRVGPLDPRLSMAADWDWFLRAHDLGVPMLVHDEVVLYYRRHAANVTNDQATLHRELLKLFRQTLLRRRAMGEPTADAIDPGRFMAMLRRAGTTAA